MSIRTVSLGEAIDQIRKTRILWADTDPFLFMVGAGVSRPVIPTAGAIIQDCKDRLHSAEIPPPTVNEYTWYVEKAFANVDERARYFSSLMEGKPFSRTNRLLAQALSTSVLGHLLITTNFDDQVERALSVLGKATAVIDALESFYRLGLAGPHPTIVYLHGKFVFSDLIHSSDESKKRSDSAVLGIGIHSMRERLEDLMVDRSPLIFGYSGSMNDVFVEALQNAFRKRRGDKPPVFWFCFSAGDAPRIRSLFSDHKDLRIVTGAESLPAYDSLASLLDCLMPTGLSDSTGWNSPRVIPGSPRDSWLTFVTNSQSLRLAELEDAELLELSQNLLASREHFGNEGDDVYLDQATRQALHVADILLNRDQSVLAVQMHVSDALEARGYYLYASGRYAESLALFDRIQSEVRDDRRPDFLRLCAQTSFFRSNVLGILGRGDDAEAEQRQSMSIMTNPTPSHEVLGYSMMTLNNLANRLETRVDEVPLTEAERVRSWIMEIYPGPVNHMCVEAFYRNLNCIGLECYGSRQYDAALTAFDKVLAGKTHLADYGLEQIFMDAMEMRASIFFFQERFDDFNEELSNIGKLPSPYCEHETRLRIKFGRLKIKMLMMLIGLGVRIDPAEIEMTKVLWDDPQTTEQRAALALVNLMQIRLYFAEHKYAESTQAADELFRRLGADPPGKVLRSFIGEALLLSMRSRAALMYAALMVQNEAELREQASELCRAAIASGKKRGPQILFLQAYGHYLLGELAEAKVMATECARRTTAPRRIKLSELIAVPEEEDAY